MDFLQLAQNRFSVRKFTDQKIEDEKLNKILTAGQVAPTACNNQPQRIFVLKSKESLEKWSRCTGCHFNEQLVILTGYNKKESWKRPFDGQDSGYVDSSIITTQMMLEAYQLGIGSTWVMFFDPAKLANEFDFGEDVEIVSALPMGYPVEDAKPNPLHFKNKDLNETVTIL